jgi:hypothetical protein
LHIPIFIVPLQPEKRKNNTLKTIVMTIKYSSLERSNLPTSAELKLHTSLRLKKIQSTA